MAGSMFSIGTEVEVSLDKGKVGDVWYLAVLIGEVGNKAFLVECYKTDSNNEASQRRVTVDALHIRPCPPSLEYRDFTLFGKADVFCGFGWARGLITRFLEDDRYIVLLDHTNEEKELSLGDMRPCMDWIDGKWVTKVGNLQKVIIVENKEQSLVETKTMSPKSGVEIPDASVPGKTASASINASKEDGQLQCMSIVIGLKCKKTRDVHTPHRKEKQSVKLLGREKKHLNAAELLQNSTQGIAEPESGVSSQKRKRGRPPNSMTKGNTVTEENGAETVSSEVLMKDNPEIEAVRLSETVAEENEAETVSSEVLMKDNPEIEAVRLSETGIISQGRKKHKKRLGGPRRRTNKLSNIVSPLERINKQSNLTVGSKSSSVLKTYSSKRQIQRSISDTEPLIPDTEDAFGEKTSRVNEAVVNETLSQNSDDLPLLTWFGGKKSQSTVHDSGISLDNTIKQCTNINGRREETATKSPATASEDVIESEKDEKLPFAKCFPVWPILESMEVFRQIPQKPHFKPLFEVKESNREGLAIAHMVTFANIAEASSKMQIDDLKITIESNLETLADLEAHGFKVGPVRDRLNQFLLKKDEKGKLVDRLQVVRAGLEERSHESSKIDEEVQELDRKIEELQAKLDSAKSGGGKIDAIIAAMEIENDVINRDVQSARHDFEILAATPW